MILMPLPMFWCNMVDSSVGRLYALLFYNEDLTIDAKISD